VNCLYAGWKKLLASKDNTVAGDSLKLFRERWNYAEGDQALTFTFPEQQYAEPEEGPADRYGTEDTPACFAASGSGMLGCDLALLPTVPGLWLRRTFDRFAVPLVSLPEATSAPTIHSDADGRYHGERLDLNKVDLGQVLHARLEARRPADRVVLRLTGQGDRTTSPIRVKGIKELVLYFEQNPEAPLTLGPDPRTALDRTALIEVADGTLEMAGARFRFENSKFAPAPKHMLAIRNGNLRLFRCRLEGPMEHGPASYQGLILFDAETAADAVLAVNESILISGKMVVTALGRRCKLRFNQCLLVASQDAFQVDFRPDSGPLNTHWLLDKNTLAVRGAVVKFLEAPAGLSPKEPLVIEATANLFLAPFSGPKQACVMRCPGATVARGLVLWRGSKNGFDQKRLHSFLATAENHPQDSQPFTAWTRLWGPRGDTQPFLFDLSGAENTLLNAEQPPELARLVGVLDGAGSNPPGADLARLGIKKPSR
jgi:hypothetical protein